MPDTITTPLRWLVAIDPGLDTTGIALYRLEPLVNVPLDPEIALNLLSPLLIDVHSLTPDVEKLPWLPERLNDLCAQLREYLRRCAEVYPELPRSVGRIIIEEPANFFNYARGGVGGPAMVKGLYLMGMATAAITMALRAAGQRPVMVKADNTKRETKQLFAAQLWQRAGQPVTLRRPGHAISDDARSAVWLGACYLLNRPPTRTPKAKKQKQKQEPAAELPTVLTGG